MKRRVLLLIILLTACRQKANDTVMINVDKGHQAVSVTGIPIYTLHGIKADSLSMETWQNLLPVAAMPADTDMRNYQAPMKGKYSVSETAIIFKPDTPFKAGQTYFARYYKYDKDISLMDI